MLHLIVMWLQRFCEELTYSNTVLNVCTFLEPRSRSRVDTREGALESLIELALTVYLASDCIWSVCCHHIECSGASYLQIAKRLYPLSAAAASADADPEQPIARGPMDILKRKLAASAEASVEARADIAAQDSYEGALRQRILLECEAYLQHSELPDFKNHSVRSSA